MNLKDKYCSLSEKTKPENKDKIVLDDKDYLLIDALYNVANYLRRKK
jgi:hypothetical protein